MEELRIEGGARLKGSVTVSGSKNAALPALAAAVLMLINATVSK